MARQVADNIMDTSAMRAFAFKKTDRLRNCWSKNTTWPIMTADEAEPKALVITLLAQLEALRRQTDTVEEEAMCAAVTNLVMPKMNGMTPEDELALMQAYVRVLMGQPTKVPMLRFRAEDWRGAIVAPTPDQRARAGPLFGIDGLEFGVLRDVNLNIDDCRKILEWASNLLSDIGKHYITQVYVTMYVALAKRGAVTEAKATKVSAEISDTVGYHVDVTQDLVASLFSAVSPHLEAEDYPVIFHRWGLYMETSSLRMRITLQQAVGSGLTALYAIKTAYAMFPNFAWDSVSGFLPVEAANIVAAFEAVGTDEYYGFKKDLGPAASTKYRSFAWVAKEMLIKYGGPEGSTLRGYKGWTKSPAHKDALEKLIEQYDAIYNSEVAPNKVASDTIATAAVRCTGI